MTNNLNINHIHSNSTSKKGSSNGKTVVELSSADRASQKQIATALKDFKAAVGKQTTEKTNKAIIQLLTKILKSSDKSAINEATIKRIVKSFTNDVLKDVLKKAGGNGTSSQNTSASSKINPDKIINDLTKKLEASLGKLFSKLESKGIEIDPTSRKQLAREIEGAVSKAVPQKAISVMQDLDSTLNNLLSLSKTSIKAFSQMKSMKTSGGKLDIIKEFGPFLKSLQEGTKEFSTLKDKIGQLKKDLSSLPVEFKIISKAITDAATSIRNTTVARAGTVRRQVSDSPALFMKDASKQISAEIKKAAPSLSNSKLIKALDNFSGSASDFLKLANSLENFGSEIKVLKNIELLDVAALKSVLDKFNTVISNVPKGAKESAINSPEWKDFFSRMDKAKKALSTLSAKLDLDTGDAVKQIDDLIKNRRIELGVNVDTKEANTQIGNLDQNVTVKVKYDLGGGLAKQFSAHDIDQKLIVEHKQAKEGKRVVSNGKTTDEVAKGLKELSTAVKKATDEIQKVIKGHPKEDTQYETRLITKLNEVKLDPVALESLVRRVINDPSPKGQIFTSRAPQARKALGEVHEVTSEYGSNILKDVLNSSKKVETSLDKLIKIAEKDAVAKKEQIKQGVPSHGTPPILRDPRITTISASKGRVSSTQKEVYSYPEINISPSESFKLPTKKKLSQGEEAHKIVEENVSQLSKSLLDLQRYMVNKLDDELTKTRKSGKGDWQIVRQHVDQNITEYFKLTEGFNKKTAGKEYGFKIADIGALRKETGFGKEMSNPVVLINKFKDKVFKELLQQNKQTSTGVAEAVGGWMKRFSSEDISSWKNLDSNTTGQLVKLKKKFDTGEGTAPSKKLITELSLLPQEILENIYKNTVSAIESESRLKEKKLTRTVSLPAAKLSTTGASTFETATGSQRIIPKFATYKTGFEEMYQELIESKTFDIDKDYAAKIKGIGFRPSGTKFKEADAVSKSMLTDWSQAKDQKKVRTDITSQYKTAAILRADQLTRTKQIEKPSDFLDKFNKVGTEFINKFEQGSIGMDELVSAMQKMGLSAYDVVKSMETVEFKNIYQMFQKIMEGGEGVRSPLEALGQNPQYSKTIREFETHLRKLVGTIPIADPSRPRRAAHQERIVNMMSMASPIYSKGTGGMTPDALKQFIRDLNLSLRDYTRDTQTLINAGPSSRKLPTGITNISSLGVPESQATHIDEFRRNVRNEDTKYLGAFAATNIKMYTDTLSELAPFGAQFQQLGRNIANVTNAMAYRSTTGIGTDFPSLRSEREQTLISGGRYGKEGYGFNVVAELRNTASTFEDQIVISGKLADVLTSVTKTIVQPDKLGRLSLVTSEGQISEAREGKVTDVKQGQVLVSAFGAIEEANRVFQEVLGVKQEYRGRADEALIKDVQKAITVVRGKDLNVQAVKIAETFFNYYGRKFTTRYGSKGVAITAEGGSEATGKQVAERFSGKKIKILSKEERATAGLGTAIAPKSMGELLSELIRENAAKLKSSTEDTDKLRKDLVASGNKFMMSMFTDASLGVVPADQAKVQQSLFNKVNEAIKGLDLTLGKDIAGITGLKESYKTGVKDPKLFKELPIDIRISSHGAAKRGLQTETLETVMSNVISAGKTGSTVLKTKFDPKVYQNLLGTSDEGEKQLFPSLSEYSKVLGFERQPGKKVDIQADILKMLKSRGIKGTDEELSAQAAKLAALEFSSNFYTNIIDEFGKSRKSLVGPKFVEILEDPHANPPWSETDIAKQIKGEKLNIPAFGAYASIFGEQSQFIKQLSKDIPLEAKKHWEYLKALQVLNDDSSEMTDHLLQSAQKVDIKALKGFGKSSKGFTKSTGKFVSSEEMKNIELMSSTEKERILNDTILDIAKYPGAVDLQIPSTKDPSQRESFYVPGALARTTYPEPSIAGERGLDLVSRRLQNVVNAALKVEAARDGGTISDDGTDSNQYKTIGRIKKRLANYRGEVGSIVGPSAKDKQLSIEEETNLQSILDKLMPTLEQYKVDPRLTYGKQISSQNVPFQSRGDYIKDFFQRQLGTGKSKASAYETTIGQAVDQLIGPAGELGPTTKYPKRFEEGASVLGQKAKLGKASIEQFSQQLNITPALDEDYLKIALEGLEKAKIDYYSTLATTVLGKTGSVQSFLFNRKIPAVMAKAVNATVDKTEDLEAFSKTLLTISSTAGDVGIDLSSLTEAAKNIDAIRIEHTEIVKKQRTKGMPVLKQHELGIPKSYAEKLPTHFTREFSVKGGKVSELPSAKYMKSNLAEMLEYREQLTEVLSSVSPDMQGKIKTHMATDLSPFIESVRFPFTGTSSVQPYEAKLLKGPGADRKELGKHIVMAPGVPEMDTAAFGTVKKQVEEVLSKLVVAREKEQEKDIPNIEKIERLTNTIGALDKAISEVIPKYIAHQQKLDFDGDQLVVHSAKTAAARQEIEQHYKSLTDYDFSKGTTAQAFRDEFTYEALIPSTGKYTLAEQQLSFQNKFPEKEGFGFLTKPFLTEDIEYLKPEERLSALANVSGTSAGATNPLSVLTNLLPELYRNEGTIATVTKAIESVKAPLDKEGKIDQSIYSAALLEAIKQLGNSYENVMNEGVRNALFDAKFLNAIGGNLFKINTGPDTEALNRLLKVFETNLGFGGGVIKQGTGFSPSPNLQKRFPVDLNVTGKVINEELNTMMNELLRVGIQKGLDVKKAGETPIATEIAKLISQGTSGVGELVTKINKEEGAYKDLKEFSDANKQVLEKSMGALSTDELYEDALKIAKGRGKKSLSVPKSRKELKTYITRSIGFEGFLHELSNQVIEAAYEGVIESIKKWNPDTIGKELQGKTPAQYAKDKVSDQLKSGGINVSELAESSLMPLYKFRTSGASGYKQRGIYQKKYGDVQVPELEGMFSGNEKTQKQYFAKYKEAKAVAKNLQDSLADFSVSGKEGKGSYSMLLKSSIENIHQDQRTIMELITRLNKEGDRMSSDIMSRLSGQDPMHSFTKSMLAQKNKKESLKYLEKYGRVVGVPSIGQESQMQSEHRFTEGAAQLAKAKKGPVTPQGQLSDKDYTKVLEAYDKDLAQLKDKYLADAILVAQSDTILKAAKTKASEGLFLSHLFPSDKEPITDKTYADKRARLMERAREKVSSQFGTQYNPPPIGSAAARYGMASSTGIPSGAALLSTGGGPIPVHIASIAQGVGVFMGKASGMAATTEEYSPRRGISKELITRIKRAEEIVSELTGGLNELKDTDFGVKYRASALKGGYGSKQIDRIKDVMTGKSEETDLLKASSLLGTGIHAKLEDKYRSDPKYITEIEKPTRYMDPLAGEISGTIDVIRKSTDGTVEQIIDIKTTSQKNFNVLKDALDRFQEKTGKTKATVGDIKQFLPSGYLKNTKLDEIASQLNLYLAAENKGATAAAHFYSNVDTELDKPIEIYFKFDKSKLERDMKAVSQARKEVKQEGKPFAKTGTFGKAKEISELLKQKEIADSTIDELIATATEYYTAITKEGKEYVGMASKGSIFGEDLKNISSNIKQQKARAKMADDMIRATPVPEGAEASKVHINLTSMHQRAKLFQQDLGIAASGESLKTLSPKIQEAISKVPDEGPKGADFFTLIDELKETGELEGKDITKAWKSYRIAVGDYYTKLMESTKSLYEQADVGSVEQHRLYGEYQDVVKRFQSYVKASLGKPTDIYTYNKSFISPESARGAGAFMSTSELVKKSAAPLGEDDKLIAIFKRMTDLDRDTLPIPRESVREALEDLTGMDRLLIDVYTDAEKVSKMGDLINDSFDFTKIRSSLPRLREALQSQLSFNVKDAYDPEQITYLKTVLKELKALESTYINIDLEGTAFEDTTGAYKFPTLIDVPKQLSRTGQEALHLGQIERVRTHFRTPEMEGGAKKGDVYAYNKKIFTPNNKVISSQRIVFSKYGDVLNNAKQKVGEFKEDFTDLNKIVAQGNRTFSVAIERVVKWGAAAGVVYGGLSYIKDAVRHMTDVETAMARLRMVMNPLSTDFDDLRNSAIGFAKQYGVETTDVLGGMKVFAQQGLSQGEVVDRTQTSTLAANVTTLSARDATEALTAAMKIFRTEGDSSMRFLDSWSQVEAKAAITAGDLADAIKKAASAGKNAGFTFDELNGMIAAIGSVTRQTGKEVGTSLRFIFRRLSAEKGPKELQKVGVDVMSDKGTLKPGFEVLSDLANVWDDLGKAQKLSIAQAIGGTRQYNQVLVLMDNWDETLKSLSNSMNAKGSAERRNLILMKTYAKQLEQTKAVFSELKIEVGKVVLPSFKTGLAGVRGLIEIINNVPGSVKLAGASLVLFLGYVAKGASILDGMVNAVSRVKISFSEMSDALSSGFKKGAFELFESGSVDKTSDLYGLKSLKSGGITDISQLDSALGKLGYTALTAGRSFNEFLGIVGKDTSAAVSAVGAFVLKIGTLIDNVGKVSIVGARVPGPVDDAVAWSTKFTGDALQGGGKATKFVGDKFGAGAQSFIEKYASQNTGAIKSMAPLIGATAGIVALAPQVKKAFKVLTQSAEEYKKQQYDVTEADAKEIESINELISEYGRLEKQVDRIKKLKSSDVKDRSIAIDEYKSPLLAQAKFQKETKTFHAKVGALSSGLVSGFDEFGNVILNNTNNLGGYLKELQQVKKVQMAMSQIDIASKFVEDLTKVDGIQEWKYQLKELAAEIPLIGELIAKEIAVGPKKALEVINKELNRLLGAKAAAPLSTAFDPDIKKSMEAQAKVLRTFTATYAGLTKTLASINTYGMSKKNITKIFTDPEAVKAYDLMAQVEEKYNIPQVKGTVTGKDIMASKVLGATTPALSGFIEPTPVLTIDKLLEAGKLPRNYGTKDITAKTGDYVALNKEFADAYGIATQQAILKVEGADKIFLEYFDKNLERLVISEQFTKDEIEQNVQAIFPTNELIKRAEEDITKLNTFIVGASAGILGLSDKTLTKRKVDIGERFYSEIPTDVLIQTGKGYDPTTKTFGEQEYKKGYQEDFIKKFYEPLQEYHAEREKIRAEDASPQAGIVGGLSENLRRLQDILKNNSVALQYRSAIEDLNKTLEEGNRSIQKNIALERSRQKVDKETSGLMVGTTKGLEGIDYGVRNYSDLSGQQKLLLEDPTYKANAKNILLLEVELKGLMSQLDSAVSTYEDLKQIGKGPKAFGALVDTKRAEELRGVMQAVGGDRAAAEIALRVTDLKNPAEETAKNTAIIAAKIDKTERIKSRVTEQLKGGGKLTDKLAIENLDKLRKARTVSMEKGDIKKAGGLDVFINKSYGELIKKLGMKEMDYLIDRTRSTVSLPSTRRERKQEIMTRGLKGLGVTKEGLISNIEEARLQKYEETQSSFTSSSYRQQGKALKDITEAQSITGKQPFLDPAKIGKTALMGSILAGYKGMSIKEDIGKLTNELVALEKKRSSLPAEADTTAIDKQISARTKELREGTDPKKAIYTALQGLSLTAATAVKGVGMFGGSKESQLKLAGAGVGIYSIMKLLETKIGKEKMPSYFKDLSKDVGKRMADTYKTGDYTGAAKGIGGEIKTFVSEFVKDQKARKKVTGTTDEEVASSVEDRRAELKKVSDLTQIEKTQKDLVQRMNAGNTDLFRSLEAIIVAITAGTVYGYTSRKTDVSERIASGRSVAGKQNKAFLDYIMADPKLIDEYISTIVSDKDNLKKDKAEMVLGPDIIINVEKALQKGLQQAKAGEPITALKEIQEALSKLKETNAAKESIKAFTQSIKNLRLELLDSFRAFDDKRILTPIKTIGNVLKGFGGEVALPLSEREMSTQQRTFAGTSDIVKNIFTDYSKGVMIQEAQLGVVTRYSDEIKELEITMARTKGSIPIEQTEKMEQKLNQLGNALIKEKTNLEKTTSVLNDLGTSLKGLTIYQTAIQKLNDSLADLSVENAVAGITGLKGYFESMGKLMGGADPLAAIAISPEQERMGSRVGIELVSGVSNAMELEKAQLRTSYKEAGSGRDRARIGLQIQDLPEKYRRQGIDQRQQAENEALKTSLQPYVELYRDLEKIKQTPGTTDEMYTELSNAQLDIKQSLKDAQTIISSEQAIKNLDRGRMGERYYATEVERLKAGPSRVYKGVSSEIGTLSEIEEKFSSALETIYKSGQGTLADSLKSIVANPLETQLITANKTLNRLVEIFEGKYSTKNEYEMKHYRPQNFVQQTPSYDEMKHIRARQISGSQEHESEKLRRLRPTYQDHENRRLKAYGDSSKATWLDPNKVKKREREDEDYYLGIANGGRIFGEGGPREDKVPAYLSNGEYVINTASAKKLGYDALAHINANGEIPSYADGGMLPDKLKNFRPRTRHENLTSQLEISSKDIEKYGYTNLLQGSDKPYSKDRIVKTPADKLMRYLFKAVETGLTFGTVHGTMLPMLKAGAMKFGPSILNKLGPSIMKKLSNPDALSFIGKGVHKLGKTGYNIIEAAAKKGIPLETLVSATEKGFITGELGASHIKHSLLTKVFKKITPMKDGGLPENKVGRLFGPGSPTDDKIDISASPGEFIVKQRSAAILGYDKLAYINETGKLPQFAAGGPISSINKWLTTKGKGFGGVSDELGGFVNYMQDKRLSSVSKDGLKGFGPQGIYAIIEAATRGTKGITDLLSMAEGSGRFLGEHGFSGVKSVGSSILATATDKLKKDGLWGTVKDLGIGTKDLFMEDISKGGLGLTTGLIGSLRGTSLIKKSSLLDIKDDIIKKVLLDSRPQLGAYIGKTGLTNLRKNAPELVEHININKMQKAISGISGKKSKEKALWEQFSAYQGKDKKMRYWLEDSPTNLMQKWQKLTSDDHTYKDMIPKESFIHKAYPGIGELPLYKMKTKSQGLLGSFNPARKSITVSSKLRRRKAVSTFGHELQHSIQDIEGLPGGTNPKYIAAHTDDLFGEFEDIKRYNKAVVMSKDQRSIEQADSLGVLASVKAFEFSSPTSQGLIEKSQELSKKLKNLHTTQDSIFKESNLKKYPVKSDYTEVFPDGSTGFDDTRYLDDVLAQEKEVALYRKKTKQLRHVEYSMSDKRDVTNRKITEKMPQILKDMLYTNKYRANIGEVQARDTASRLFMSKNKKKKTLPSNLTLPSFAPGGLVKSTRYNNNNLEVIEEIARRQNRMYSTDNTAYSSAELSELLSSSKPMEVSSEKPIQVVPQTAKTSGKEINNKKIRSFVGDSKGTKEIGSSAFEEYMTQQGKSAFKTTSLNDTSVEHDKWGHSTAKGVQDRILSGNIKLAKARSELAEKSRIGFGDKLDRIGYLSTYLKGNYNKIISDPDSSSELNRRTGVRSITKKLQTKDSLFASDKYMTYGKQQLKSYRTPDETYRPNYKSVGEQQSYLEGLKSSPRITKGSYPKLSTLLDYKTDLSETYSGQEFKYHEYGRSISEYRDVLFNNLVNSEDKDVRKIIAEKITAQEKALDNVDKVMEVISYGRNIYTDPSLRKKILKRPVDVKGITDPLPFFSDEDSKRFVLDQDVSYKSLLTQIKQDAENARSFLNTDLKPSKQKDVVGRPTTLIGPKTYYSVASKNFKEKTGQLYPPRPDYTSIKAVEDWLINAKQLRGYANGGPVSKEEPWYKKFYNIISSKGKSLLGHGLLGDTGSDIKSHKEKINKLNEELLGIPNNGSLPVHHNGGVLSRSGMFFGEKNEMIIPADDAKNITTGPAAQSLKESMSIDPSSLIYELKAITLQVEDKILKVEDKELKVEDKTLSVEDKILKVEDKEFTVDANNIKLDVSEAEMRLKSAIESALTSSTVKVQIESAVGTGSVGAAAFDQLAQTVSTVNDRLNIVTTKYDEDIKYLEDSMGNMVDSTIESKLATKLNNINNNVDNIRSEVGKIGDNVTSQISRTQSKLEDTTYLTHQALNAIHSNNGNRI